MSATLVLQLIISLGLLNVWIVRFNKVTSYRGGSSSNLIEEFVSYGLPAWSCYVVGFLKIGSALALLAGYWYPILIKPSAALIICLMLGALSMHAKIKDPLKKFLPAFSVLILSTIIFFQ